MFSSVRSLQAAWAALIVCMAMPAASRAALDCNGIHHARQSIGQTLERTSDWPEAVETLGLHSPHRYKYAFEIRTEDGTPLPVQPELYENTQYVVSERPPSTGDQVVGPVAFGYPDTTSAQILGILDYLVLDRQGRVVEVGAGSDKMLEEFRAHLTGRQLKPSERQRIFDLNRDLAEYLGKQADSITELARFEKARGWEPGTAARMKLVYFNAETTDLKAWAIANGYTQSELRDAGWLQLRFARSGKPYYVPSNSHVIKIPFFADVAETQVLSWRTRVLSPRPGGPKYLSHPLNRSLETGPAIESRLYQGWKLAQAKGKTVVITEGEFKSRVATESTGILHLGLPGITEFDDSTIAALVKSGASEVIVVFDRDPKGKALMRVDEVTDSERAAYQIARELEGRVPSVRVGTLPDVFEGGKVGIDDLILGKGVDPYRQALADAVSPAAYAQAHGIDPQFHELLARKKKLVRALDHYHEALRRGVRPADPRRVQQAIDELELIEEAIRLYLRKVLGTNRQLHQPSVRYDFLRQLSRPRVGVPSRFEGDIVLMDLVAADLAPFEQESLGLADALRATYPPDDYAFEFGVVVRDVSLPLVVSKKDSGKVVAIVQLRTEGSPSLSQKLRSVLRPN